MPVTKYRTKPVVIEAVRWMGNNIQEIYDFTGHGAIYNPESGLSIMTLEGTMKADVGDYIIKGLKGEFYPCKPHIFHLKYEKELVWDENI